MGSKPILALVCLLLVGGAAIAWFSTRGGPGRGSGATAPMAAIPREPSSARPAADLQDGGGLVDTGQAQAPRLAFTTAPKRVGGPAKEAARAGGPRLTGRIVDPLGLPVAGARIVAADGDGLPLDVELPADSPFVRGRAIAETDGAGHYVLEGLRPGSLGLLVRKPGFAPYSEARIAVPEAEAFELPEIVLAPGAILAGWVVDPYGLPVAGAKLHVEEARDVFRFRRGFSFDPSGAAPVPSAVTDKDGAFRIDELALGAWRVRVESENHPDRIFEGLTERAGQVVTRTFELEAGETLTGRVTGIPDAERDRLVVRANSDRGDGSAGFGTRDADVSADGTFAFAGLRPGAAYVLQARERQTGFRFGGFTGRTRSERVRATAGSRGVEIAYQPEAAVLFQAVDARSGEPVEAFEVRYGFRWPEPLRGAGSGPLREHPEGRVRVGNLRPDGGVEHLELQIDAVGYERWERKDVPVGAGQETDLGRVRLQPLPIVTVRVVDEATGEPVAGAQVRIEEEAETERGFGSAMRVAMSIDEETGEPVALGEPGRSARTDEDGVARLNSMPGRVSSLAVTRDGYAPARIAGLYLPPGEPVERTVELGAGGEVVVLVVDEAGAPLPGVRVDHRGPEGEDEFVLPFRTDRRDAITDADGQVRFPHLVSGEHRFRIRRGDPWRRGGAFVVTRGGGSEDQGWSAVDVAAGPAQELTLVQGALGVLRGRVTEAGADLVGATVQVRPHRDDDGGWTGFVGGGEGERTDSSGRYRIEGLDPGPYQVTIEHPKRRMPMSFDVDVKAGETRFDADLPLSIVEGRVTDQEGKPLAGIEVAARRVTGAGRRGRTVMFRAVRVPGGGGGDVVTLDDDLGESAMTDADGRFSLRGVTPDVEIVVRASGSAVQTGESEPFVVKADSVRRGVDLTLEASGSIEIDVLRADGGSVDFAFLRATYLDDVPEGGPGPGSEPKFAAAQDGRATLAGLRPGRWSVALNPFGGPGGSTDEAPEPQEVQVEAGRAAHVTVRM